MAASQKITDFAATIQPKVQAYAEAYHQKMMTTDVAEELTANEADDLAALDAALTEATTLAAD